MLHGSVPGATGREDGVDDGSWCQQCCIRDGADHGLSLSCPQAEVAIGGLALNRRGPRGSFAAVVSNLDPAGVIKEGQKLITSLADLGLKRSD